jgi:hypothetical protein
MLLLYLQISQGGETIPIANEIPESACQVIVTNITAKEEFVICYNTSRINITNIYMLIFVNMRQKETERMLTGGVGS